MFILDLIFGPLAFLIALTAGKKNAENVNRLYLVMQHTAGIAITKQIQFRKLFYQAHLFRCYKITNPCLVKIYSAR